MKSIVKVLAFIHIAVLFCQCEKEETSPLVKKTVNNFLIALIELGIDTDGDGQISNAEAEVVDFLNVSYDSISDMTGIEKFVNLKTLICRGNQLTFLNVTNITALEKLYCAHNQLSTLNVSNNKLLTDLRCQSNQLSTLDISSNITLEILWCDNNLLYGLDLLNIRF